MNSIAQFSGPDDGTEDVEYEACMSTGESNDGVKDPVDLYLDQIGMLPLLSHARQSALFAQIDRTRLVLMTAVTLYADPFPMLSDRPDGECDDTESDASILQSKLKILHELHTVLSSDPGRGSICCALRKIDVPIADIESAVSQLADSDSLRRKLLDICMEFRNACRAVSEGNLRLVVSVAKQFRHSTMDFLDLIEEGNVALLRAVELFDSHRGVQFSTFARRKIYSALIRTMDNQGDTIRVPVHMQTRRRKQDRANALSDQERGQEVVASDSLQKMTRQPLDLETGSKQSPDSVLAALENRELVLMLIKKHLNARERDIICMRYGLAPYDRVYTLEQIGEKYSFRHQRAQQIVKRAMQHLVQYLQQEYPYLFSQGVPEDGASDVIRGPVCSHALLVRILENDERTFSMPDSDDDRVALIARMNFHDLRAMVLRCIEHNLKDSHRKIIQMSYGLLPYTHRYSVDDMREELSREYNKTIVRSEKRAMCQLLRHVQARMDTLCREDASVAFVSPVVSVEGDLVTRKQLAEIIGDEPDTIRDWFHNYPEAVTGIRPKRNQYSLCAVLEFAQRMVRSLDQLGRPTSVWQGRVRALETRVHIVRSVRVTDAQIVA